MGIKDFEMSDDLTVLRKDGGSGPHALGYETRITNSRWQARAVLVLSTIVILSGAPASAFFPPISPEDCIEYMTTMKLEVWDNEGKPVPGATFDVDYPRCGSDGFPVRAGTVRATSGADGIAYVSYPYIDNYIREWGVSWSASGSYVRGASQQAESYFAARGYSSAFYDWHFYRWHNEYGPDDLVTEYHFIISRLGPFVATPPMSPAPTPVPVATTLPRATTSPPPTDSRPTPTTSPAAANQPISTTTIQVATGESEDRVSDQDTVPKTEDPPQPPTTASEVVSVASDQDNGSARVVSGDPATDTSDRRNFPSVALAVGLFAVLVIAGGVFARRRRMNGTSAD